MTSSQSRKQRVPSAIRPPTEPLANGVLLVDDDTDVRGALAEVLRDSGYRVETAATGLEALDRLRWGFRPCVILLDLRMQVMTGWDFRTEQQRDASLAGIPVIAMTAGAWKAQDAQAFAAIVRKPIDFPALNALIARFC